MSAGLRSGRKYRLRADAVSRLGLHPDEVVTFVRTEGGGKIKDELMPIRHVFERADGTPWVWSRSVGELLAGWLEEVPDHT